MLVDVAAHAAFCGLHKLKNLTHETNAAEIMRSSAVVQRPSDNNSNQLITVVA